MTKINKVSENNRRPFLTPKNTGYLAAGALVLSSARAFNKSKPVVKSHKYIGFFAAFFDTFTYRSRRISAFQV